MPRSRFHTSPVDLTKASYEELYSLLLAGDYERKQQAGGTPDLLMVSVLVFICLVFFNVILGESTIAYEADSIVIEILRDIHN
jgi:hypothetical protein